MARDYQRTFSFCKNKILKQLLSRGSHFKIHFSLGFWGNRGSSQNFHGTPFSGDRKIIIPSHMIIPILLLKTYRTYSKHKIYHMHGCKKINMKTRFIHTKICNKTKTDLSRTFFFCYFL